MLEHTFSNVRGIPSSVNSASTVSSHVDTTSSFLAYVFKDISIAFNESCKTWARHGMCTCDFTNGARTGVKAISRIAGCLSSAHRVSSKAFTIVWLLLALSVVIASTRCFNPFACNTSVTFSARFGPSCAPGRCSLSDFQSMFQMTRGMCLPISLKYHHLEYEDISETLLKYEIRDEGSSSRGSSSRDIFLASLMMGGARILQPMTPLHIRITLIRFGVPLTLVLTNASAAGLCQPLF